MPQQSSLPMFPLGLVSYPTVGLNLHIFEERYRQLMADAEQDGIRFGITAVLESGELQKIGTEMVLAGVEKRYDDGRLDVKTLGMRRFKIVDFEAVAKDKLYGVATVEYLDTDYDGDEDLYTVLLDQVKMVFDIFSIDKKLPALNDDFNTFKMASHAALNIDQELELIAFDKEIDRQLYLVDHLNEFIPKAKAMEEMRKKVQMNGHFRNILPPDLS